MKIYYNEIDKKKCAALYQLMKDGHISKGDIDDRSIVDVKASDVIDYGQCHFFAGIGLWDYAIRLSEWNKPVWTGSCPCQPFSSAGRKKGKEDERHLWPEWFRLISECKPSTIFAEQVATAIAQGWADDVYEGLEKENYAVGAAVLPASSIGAPHKRERLWIVAHLSSEQGNVRCNVNSSEKRKKEGLQKQVRASSCIMGNGKHNGSSTTTIKGSNDSTISNDTERKKSTIKFTRTSSISDVSPKSINAKDRNPWKNSLWISCPDGKRRMVKPDVCMLVDGYPERVGIIHCAGDAIVAQVAAEFITACKGYV